MYPNDVFELNLGKTCLITALSILLSLFLSLSPRSSLFPPLSSAASVYSSAPATSPPSPSPQPPTAANDLQKVRLAWQRAGSRSLLQEQGMHGRQRCSRDGGSSCVCCAVVCGPSSFVFWGLYSFYPRHVTPLVQFCACCERCGQDCEKEWLIHFF